MPKLKQGQSAYEAALGFLTPKARTTAEVENYLDGGNYSEMEIIQAVERLARCGLVDDRRYAKDFIESRLNTKPVSRHKLREQLEGHSVADEIIDDALKAVTDEVEHDNAMSVAEKFFRQFSGLELPERLRRVGLRLAARGYSYDCIKIVLSEITDELPD